MCLLGHDDGVEHVEVVIESAGSFDSGAAVEGGHQLRQRIGFALLFFGVFLLLLGVLERLLIKDYSQSIDVSLQAFNTVLVG